MAARTVPVVIAAWLLLLCVNSAEAQSVVCPQTPAAGTSNTQCANTAFVQKRLAAGISVIAVGTFAQAGTCNAGNAGRIAVITDSTTNAWGGAISGSGTDQVLAWCNGTNWTVVGQ